MNILDLLDLSIRNLKRRKIRTALTILSITIGTAAIILMLSLGFAIEKSNQDLLDSVGGLTMIEVFRDGDYYPGQSMENTKKSKPLTEKELKKYKNLPHVKAILPKKNVEIGGIMSGKFQSNPMVYAVDSEYLKNFGYELENGDWLENSDKDTFLYTNMSFYDYSSRDFEPQEIDPFKDKLKIRVGYEDPEEMINTGNKSYKDFSIKPKGKIKSSSFNAEVYISKKFAKELEEANEKLGNNFDEENDGKKENNKREVFSYDSVSVKVDDVKYVQETEEYFKDLGYNTESLLEISQELSDQSRKIQMILGGIGAISLLVAAIGIANTMIMSIYERTREIGVMKVIGASIEDIRNIFLTESALIGLMGGIIGIIVSYLGSKGLNFLAAGGAGDAAGGMMLEGSAISVIPPWLYLIAAIFSAFIGLISGYMPAVKATKISAIDAIKTN